MKIGSNPAQARAGGESLEVQLGIEARGKIIALEIGARVAAEAALGLERGALLPLHGIADKHSETLPY